jgi:DNA-binding NarL/FixJ family response regulator
MLQTTRREASRDGHRFLAYIDSLLAVFANDSADRAGPAIPNPAAPPRDSEREAGAPIPYPLSLTAQLVEPLSERELDVLRLIAAGHSNQAIADILIIAVSTIKRHINNIYGKLGVQSRTQALVRARELALL